MTILQPSLETTMGALWRRRVAMALASILAAVAGPAAAAPDAPSGLRVEAVEAGSLAERSGLRAGDVLLEWRRAASAPWSPLPGAGPLESPFVLEQVLVEETPRGVFTLMGERGGAAKAWMFSAGASRERIGLRVVAPMPRQVEAAFAEGKAALASGGPAAASRIWKDGAIQAFQLHRPDAALWLLRERALALLQVRDFGAAAPPFEEALNAARLAGESTVAADLYLASGRSRDEWGHWKEARIQLERGLAVLGSSGPSGSSDLLRARIHFALGEVHRHGDDYASAQPHHEAALRLRRLRAPHSLDFAESLFTLARMRSEIGAGETGAEELMRAAERLTASLDSGSLFHARVLTYLGLIAWNSGRTGESERLLEEAYRAVQARSPSSYEAARIVLYLAMASDRRGDLERAEACYSQALEIWQRLPPTVINRRSLATTWWALAYLKQVEGDLESAEAYALRALEIQETIQTRSLGVAEALDILGHVEGELGRYEKGRGHLRRSIEIRQELMPGHIQLAASLAFLGSLELNAGTDLPEAERLLRRSDAIHRASSPASLSRADTLAYLAEAMSRQGRRREALACARQALTLRQRLAPGRLIEAESLHQIGRLERQAGRMRSAAEASCGAAAIIERLGDRLAGTQRTRTSFTAAYGPYFFDCLEARLGQGRNAEAFRILEAGRARVLLDLFTSRDLDLDELAPELRREREAAYREYGSLSERMEAASARGDSAAADRLRGDLLENQRRLDRLSVRVRAASPRLAALRYPEPLDWRGAARALDPGTVLLSYAVGRERSYLFVLDRNPALTASRLRVFALEVGSDELARQVEEFRSVVSDPASLREAVRERGARLYDLLLAPAERLLTGARRLLIVPDGALHLLPFAALSRADGRFLVEWKPIHKIASATVYGEVTLRRRQESGDRRTRRGSPRVGIVGGPSAEGSELPGAGEEVASLAALLGSSTQILTGPSATEPGVAALARTLDILHFATHAYVDEAVPLNSALQLSPSSPEGEGPGRADGRYETWEIAETLRLDADLVTLAACETGLGRMSGGEGLMGLTRAFQIAGARSVISSLWAIEDAATARFMLRLYRHLLRGESKDEALRRAQVESLNVTTDASPSSWAAFDLIGDPF